MNCLNRAICNRTCISACKFCDALAKHLALNGAVRCIWYSFEVTQCVQCFCLFSEECSQCYACTCLLARFSDSENDLYFTNCCAGIKDALYKFIWEAPTSIELVEKTTKFKNVGKKLKFSHVSLVTLVLLKWTQSPVELHSWPTCRNVCICILFTVKPLVQSDKQNI